MFWHLLWSFHLWISWKDQGVEVGEEWRGRMNWDDTSLSLTAWTAPLSPKCDQINIEGPSWLPSEDYMWEGEESLLLAAGSREICRRLHFEILSSNKFATGDSIKNILQWANCTKEIVFIRKVILSIESGDMCPFTPLWCKNKQGYGIHFTILIGPACTISKPSVIPKFWLNIYVTSDAFTIDYYIEFWRYFAIKMMKGLMAYSY